jgi:hypothetical protein
MIAVLGFAKEAGLSIAPFLNQPYVKEKVKTITGTVSFTFGLIEIYDLGCLLRRHSFIQDTTSVRNVNWIWTAQKVIRICHSVSLILSASVSRPGVFLISSLAGRICSAPKLEQLFGPYTTFALNPWHPRHIASIAAVLFAIPSLMQLGYQGMRWTYRRISSYSQRLNELSSGAEYSTCIQTKLMIVFNTLTSRPILHLLNNR